MVGAVRARPRAIPSGVMPGKRGTPGGRCVIAPTMWGSRACNPWRGQPRVQQEPVFRMTRHNPLLVSPEDAPHLVDDPAIDARLDRLRDDCVLAPPRPMLFRRVQADPALPSPQGGARAGWDAMRPAMLNPAVLAGNRLFPDPSPEPAAAAIDLLRGRLLQALQDRGWRRVAVTSPTRGCGKSTVAANLALSLARRPSGRTVLIDLDLRRPGLAHLFGLPAPGPIRDLLTGRAPPAAALLRAGRGLALGLNARAEAAAAELLLEPAARVALGAVLRDLDPEVVIHDLAPVLGSDDAVAILPQVDAVLLVVDGTQTTAAEIRACERLFEGRVPLLGVVLNRAQDRGLARLLRRGG